MSVTYVTNLPLVKSTMPNAKRVHLARRWSTFLGRTVAHTACGYAFAHPDAEEFDGRVSDVTCGQCIGAARVAEERTLLAGRPE